MAHFTQALKTVLDRSFGGKQSAMATADIQQADISKLIREAAPLTSEKLLNILAACEDSDDHSLLVHAAVRDFVGDEEYQARFCTFQPATEHLIDGLGGAVFQSHFPIHPRAEQVLRYLLNRLQHDPDVEAALILLGKFLELPEPLAQPQPGSIHEAIADMAAQISGSGKGKRGKSAG